MSVDVKAKKHHGFDVVNELVDPDGVVAVVTRHAKTGHVSFSFMKEFIRPQEPGVSYRTTFLNRRHILAARRLLDRLEKELP